MKVLVIDDEPQIAYIISNYLSRVGHYVEEAVNGEHGWQVFKQAPDSFDVVFADVVMPVCSGLELLKRFRENSYWTPVILMAGYVDADTNDAATEFEVSNILVKPFDLKMLDEILADLKK